MGVCWRDSTDLLTWERCRVDRCRFRHPYSESLGYRPSWSLIPDIDSPTSTVAVRRSKTDREGEGMVLYLGKPTLKRVRAWLEAAEL